MGMSRTLVQEGSRGRCQSGDNYLFRMKKATLTCLDTSQLFVSLVKQIVWPVNRVRNRLGNPYYRLGPFPRLGFQPCSSGWPNPANAEQRQIWAFWLADCPYFPTARLGGAVRTTDCNPPIASATLSTGQLPGCSMFSCVQCFIWLVLCADFQCVFYAHILASG